ncbi:MAG: UDP-N-acetylmuramate--L-alanine ligase [Thermodesulforhabdaceae bacterium]|jgi:UDP-N-acetylmuramate: L-alanyl-gamma-D-glutamyl-meso-diaminopimelate ligase
MAKRDETLYFMGIGGVAMGNMAGACKELGYKVVGSDSGLYPPMSTLIEKLGIEVFIPYDAENLRQVTPDKVVIGNVIRATNPEARWVLENKMPFMSITDLIEEVFLSRHKSLVVSGTHGKTTTTALLSWALTEAGLDPSALVGGFVKAWGCGYRLGKGGWVVLEGDEYDTAFFDKTPKFWHYRPFGAIVTSVEFDHGDIYPDLQAIREAFRHFVSLIPPDGFLVLRYEDPHREELAEACKGRVITYGVEEGADVRLLSFIPEGGSSFIEYSGRGGKRESFRLPLIGKHNALNAVAVATVLEEVGLDCREFSRFFEGFSGVKRRQEVIGRWKRGSKEIVLIDDFAHHPTAVKETLRAVKNHYAHQRIIAVFEPRSNTSKRRFFQDVYPQSFDGCDLAVLKAPADYERIPIEERIDIEAIVETIKNNGREIDARAFFNADETVRFLLESIQPGDVVVFMSNGSMDNVPQRVKEALD